MIKSLYCIIKSAVLLEHLSLWRNIEDFLSSNKILERTSLKTLVISELRFVVKLVKIPGGTVLKYQEAEDSC